MTNRMGGHPERRHHARISPKGSSLLRLDGFALHELGPLATAIGESWAAELVHSLRSGHRAVVGEWPGTLGEARMRIRVAVRRHIDARLLDELARAANLAARRGWLDVRD